MAQNKEKIFLSSHEFNPSNIYKQHAALQLYSNIHLNTHSTGNSHTTTGKYTESKQ